MKNKRILITGGDGFIGKNLTNRLVALGNTVTITRYFKDYWDSFGDEKLKIFGCNLLRKDDCEYATRNQDYVFHCAAVTHGAAFMEKNPLTLVTPNIIMNAQMLDAAYENRVKKFVFISSSAAYPDTKEIATKEEEMFKDEPYDKYYPVAWMKRYSEVLCRTYSEKIKNPMQTVVVRPSNVFGEHDDYDFETSHVTASLIRKVAERQDPIEIWGDGNDERDIIYVDDFIDGVLLVCEKLDHYEPINIAYGKAYTIKEILNILLAIEDYDPKITFNTDRPSMIPMRRIDTSKAKNLLDFEPKTSVVDALMKVLLWYKENHLHDYHKNPV